MQPVLAAVTDVHEDLAQGYSAQHCVTKRKLETIQVANNKELNQETLTQSHNHYITNHAMEKYLSNRSIRIIILDLLVATTKKEKETGKIT
jgi:hypothetical protein